MILKIAKKHLIINARTPFNFFIYLAFPLVLIVILGAAFSGVFKEMEIKADVQILYIGDTDLNRIIKDNHKYLKDFTFTQVYKENEAREAVKKGEFDSLVIVDEINRTVKIEYLNSEDIKTTILETFFKSLLTTYNLHSTLISNGKNPPEQDLREYIKIESLQSNKGPGALDFYGITILTMIIMYGTFISSYGIIDERVQGTLSRISVTPVKRYQIFLGISLGSLLQIVIQGALIILIGHYFLNVNYGTRPLSLLTILLSQALMVVSLGIFLAFNLKDVKVVDTIINIVAQLTVFVGGGYFILPEGSFIDRVSKFSPIYWINRGLLEAIHTDNAIYIKPAIFIPLTIALVLTLLTTVRFKKGDR